MLALRTRRSSRRPAAPGPRACAPPSAFGHGPRAAPQRGEAWCGAGRRGLPPPSRGGQRFPSLPAEARSKPTRNVLQHLPSTDQGLKLEKPDHFLEVTQLVSGQADRLEGHAPALAVRLVLREQEWPLGTVAGNPADSRPPHVRVEEHASNF